MGRTLVVAASASLIAGVAVGAVARFLMRLVAVATGNGSSFSWSGTAFIIGLFVVVMFPGALLAAASSRRSRWVLLAAGAAFLFVPATGIAMEEVGSTAGFSAARWVAVLAASAGVYAAIALLPLVTLRLIDTFLPRAVGSGLLHKHAPSVVGGTPGAPSARCIAKLQRVAAPTLPRPLSL